MSTPDPKDIISRILGYLDKPWKALALALLLIVGGTGWIIWVERDKLLDAFLEAPEGPPVFRQSAIPDLLTRVLDETNVDVVAAWTVDLESNAVHFLGGRHRDGSPWKMTPSRLPAVRDNVDVEILVQVLNGQPGCADPTGRDGMFAKRIVSDGMKLVCWVPVDHFGAVSVAWKAPPDEAEREASLGVAQEAGHAATQ